MTAIPLSCPVTRQPLHEAPADVVALLQGQQRQLALRDVAARLVREPFDGAWLTADGQRAYLSRDGLIDLRPTAAVWLIVP